MIDGEEEDPTLLRIGRSLYQEMIDSRMSCLDLAMGLLGLTLTDTRTSLWKLLVRMFQRELTLSMRCNLHQLSRPTLSWRGILALRLFRRTASPLSWLRGISCPAPKQDPAKLLHS